MLTREFSNPSTEVPASWYGILNSFYIIVFAPLISKIWQSKYNISGPYKFGFGLILLAIGFAILAIGSFNIPLGAKTASVSMVFLILAYFFHTMGELFKILVMQKNIDIWLILQKFLKKKLAMVINFQQQF